MSHKRKIDYTAVFSELLKMTHDPAHQYPRVKEIMSDFEAAVWVSLKKVMPNVVGPYSSHLMRTDTTLEVLKDHSKHTMID